MSFVGFSVLQLMYIAVCVCLAVAVSVSAWLLAPLAVGRLDPTITTTTKHAGGIEPAIPTANLRMQKAKPPTADEYPKFDVVRLDPEGASVFAGRASAHQLVTILINGREFASAQADSDGQWAVVVERSIPSGQVELTLIASGPEPGRADRSQVVHITVATPKVASAAHEVRPLPKTAGPLQPKAAEPDPKQALRRFEALVDRARVAAVGEPTGAGTSIQAPVPVPITFLTAETVMTSDGEKAARLLTEYLHITKPHSIALTGHADSRGTEGYNLELSRKRLVAIERSLRGAGYAGELRLVPLGETAPYRTVDRSKLTVEQKYQIDRRVELQVTHN